ncbi:paraquat-inducible protein A [Pseudoalteromonas rubra]|uniref:Paraquat-inducible protein n=1 Tax=Pseudoalteromonas rubra TaxID=43658 RepID=A0A5S3X6W5_9GAMM|nr:paraquat-inducible protein A [Pseudoalteromonas rubra]TMP39473.1 paraquat-inducible protein [Pseudoalteromonas rubra]
MIVACQHCDYLVSISDLGEQQRAVCPHCGNVLATTQRNYTQWIAAFSLSSIIFLLLSLQPHFISYAQHGLKQTISLMAAIMQLAENYSVFLAALLSVSIVILPLAASALILMVHTPIWQKLNPHNARAVAKFIMTLRPLNLADIFLVAVLISAFKLTAFAEIEVGLGFWAYILFVLCFIETLSLLSQHQLWQLQQAHFTPTIEHCAKRASSQQLKQCQVCQQISRNEHCPRCLAKLSYRKNNSVSRSAAWMLTSLVFLIPALSFPIMDTINLGLHTPATIYGGVEVLWQNGSYPIAIVIFIASICIPLLKAGTLFYLLYRVKRPANPKVTAKFYRALEAVGKWSMIDVFVVILLVSLVQLGTVLSVEPQPGIVFFTAMVICQIFAVNNFDPRLLWDSLNKHE